MRCPGAREHTVDIELADGVKEVSAEFHFDSEDECQQEQTRIGGLLRAKYGECERVDDQLRVQLRTMRRARLARASCGVEYVLHDARRGFSTAERLLPLLESGVEGRSLART